MIHAWLVVGPPGPERRTHSRSRAAQFVGGDPQQVLTGRHPDVQEFLDPLRIENARQIASTLARPPLLGGGRALLLGELGGATREAQNALLRVVEEPPADLAFVGEVAAAGDLLPTLRSRFVLDPLPRRPREDLLAALSDEFPSATPELLDSALEAGRGYFDPARQALLALRQADEQLPPDDGQLDWFLRAAEAVDSADQTWLNGLTGRFASAWSKTRDSRFLRAWQCAEEAHSALTHNGNPRLVAEVLFSELSSLGVLRLGAGGGGSVSQRRQDL